MSFPQLINFRQTALYISDNANTYPELSSGINYPTTTAQGNTVGWETVYNGVSGRNRNSGNVPELAGCFVGTTGDRPIYRIDLPATGTYPIRLAGGEANYAALVPVEIQDTTTSLGSPITGSTSAGQRFKDATNTEYTNATWSGSNTAVNFTFTTTIARFIFGNGSGLPQFAHINVGAAVGGGSTYNESASDAITATDAATQQLTAPAAATDAASAADSASNLGVLTRSASDAAAATDAATATLTIPASASDAATATDASSSASAVNSAATDAIAAADAATQLAVLPAAASDAAAVTDAATNLGVLTRAATDAAAASDAATGLRVTLGSATDAVTATDTAAQVSAANVTATDAISAADAATVQAVLVGIVSDGFSATDAATLLAGIYNLTAADVLSLLDAALADGGVQYARAPQGAGQDLIYPAGHRSPVISGNRPGNINTARPANRGGRRT